MPLPLLQDILFTVMTPPPMPQCGPYCAAQTLTVQPMANGVLVGPAAVSLGLTARVQAGQQFNNTAFGLLLPVMADALHVNLTPGPTQKLAIVTDQEIKVLALQPGIQNIAFASSVPGDSGGTAKTGALDTRKLAIAAGGALAIGALAWYITGK